MNNDIKNIENKIKEIIEKNEDAVKGFEKAAENTKDLGVKSYFEQRAEKRKLFLKTLHNATPALQTGDQEIDGSTTGSAHRTWMDIKAFFSGDNDESMLEEAARGDKSALSEYNEILGESMVPQRVKEVIREQRDEIQNDLETSKILEKFA
ncbi:ferritin-like domain-containing protein [Maribacter aestuarii]|uniref:ferritin-like domain-containing protein n=1 Tax=Maribacter aestuarii TaxID=1130723 RepID=UPI0025A615B6|nr:PA2169 family four-helix-bundle protein [Maribacter aestuarii]